MNQLKRYVVFDTNAYSYLCSEVTSGELPDRLHSLASQEAIAGIDAYASPVVMAELVRSWEKKPNSDDPCMRIVSLVDHCTNVTGELKMISDPRAIDYLIAFGESSTVLDATCQSLADVCKAIAIGQALSHRQQEVVNDVCESIENQLAGFVTKMLEIQAMADTELDPQVLRDGIRLSLDSANWRKDYARMVRSERRALSLGLFRRNANIGFSPE